MIEVEHLTKRYPGLTAVDDISFAVGKGEVVGFLGPNGAGKSTTMRILSGYLPPSAGRVSIAGFDMASQSLKARERIGYMPENVPLYPEMRVSEYLKYRAALKGVKGRKIRERLLDVLDLCNLQEVSKRLIGNLSKGFRQRVGLADAMIHEPELLILDEPTIGLDPNQIRQVRELILNLARHHTILLSTHILPEVEMTCGRVLIINRGKIAAVDTPQNLRKKLHHGGEVCVELSGVAREDARRLLAKLPGCGEVRPSETPDGWLRFEIELEEAVEGDPREEVYQLCIRNEWKLRELSRRSVSLEDVFTKITQTEES